MKADRSQASVDAKDRTTPSPESMARFRSTVMQHYSTHRRDLPWRETRDPYLILVSEIMLQQTQVARVVDKYALFASLFPTVGSLAAAPVADVLRAWQGLGYNRRALNLQNSARLMISEYGGSVPRAFSELLRLPGVGRSTAAAVCAFAFGVPVPFLETNIRSAYIHHFFQECSRVSDAELLPLVEATLDRDNPRDWYYALMDYGSWLKKTVPNPSRQSRHNAVQSPFSGSHRQLRASILRVMLAADDRQPPEQPGATGKGEPADAGARGGTGLDLPSIRALLPAWDDAEIRSALEELDREGFLRAVEGRYHPA